MHFFWSTSSLECWRPMIFDSNLMGVELEKLQDFFLEQDEIKGCLETLISDILEVSSFPHDLQSLELL